MYQGRRAVKLSITGPYWSRKYTTQNACAMNFFLVISYSSSHIWSEMLISSPKMAVHDAGLTVRGGADKSLAWPGRKQATMTKLGIYSTYSPRSSIHFLARCSNFCKPLKTNSEGCPSSQVSAAAMTSALDEKWRHFNYFFSPENRW